MSFSYFIITGILSFIINFSCCLE